MNSKEVTVTLIVVLLALICFKIIFFIIMLAKKINEKNEEIKIRDELFAVLANSVHDIFIMIDKHSNEINYISPNIGKILGISHEEACSDISAIDNAATSEDAVKISELPIILEKGERSEWNCEYFHRQSKNRIWFHITALCKQIKGKVYYIIIMSERTKERNTELKLKHEVDSAERANKAKSVFLSNMSHDIRTPLNAIIGYSTIASDCIDKDEKVNEYLMKILASGNLLLRLVNDILDMSSIESGKFSLKESEENLSEILQGIKTIVLGEISNEKRKFDIDISGIKHEQIYCDRMRLEQLLLNLISNSIKFTSDGGEISVIITEYETDDNTISDYKIIVKDNGIGMSENFTKKIFEPFERERTSTVSRTEGTGLGLAISKNIIDMAGGTIDVNTKQGEGCVFTIHLPFRTIDNSKQYRSITGFDGIITVLCSENSKKNVTSALSKLGVKADIKDSLQELSEGIDVNRNYKTIAIIDEEKIDDYIKLSEIIDNENSAVIIIGSDITRYNDDSVLRKVNKICEKPILTSEIRDALICVIGKENSNDWLVTEEAYRNALSGKKVLIADDSAINCEIVKAILAPYNITVDAVEDGSKAIEAIKAAKKCYDLVLMDIEMPVMDGYECARQIREMGFDSNKLPILALTANVFSENRISSEENGMNEYMTKPFDSKNLIKVLYKFLKE